MGGHGGGKATARRMLHVGLWWPTLHKNSKEYVKNYDVSQRVGKSSQWDKLPLNLVNIVQIFEKWAIDFIGPITLRARHSNSRYIITTTKYLTRLAELALVKDCMADTIARFIFENIISRFGSPKILIGDQGTHFINETIESILKNCMI